MFSDYEIINRSKLVNELLFNQNYSDILENGYCDINIINIVNNEDAYTIEKNIIYNKIHILIQLEQYIKKNIYTICNIFIICLCLCLCLNIIIY